jgi:hypothetical protein
MSGEPSLEMVSLDEPRQLTAKERALIDFLLAGPLGRQQLRAQVDATRVVTRCSCGCPSVGLSVDASAPRATFRKGESPSGQTEWVPITAYQRKSRSPDTEVTLHVIDGRLAELEIWAGEYGVRPRVDPARLVYDENAGE